MGFKSILDPTFRYRSSTATDVRKTFERIRRQQRLRGSAKNNPAKDVSANSKVVGVIAPAKRKSA